VDKGAVSQSDERLRGFSGLDRAKEPLGWPAVAACVLAGAALCLLMAVSAAGMPQGAPPARAAEADPKVFGRGVLAYQNGEWEDAEVAFREVITRTPNHARALDYLERLSLIRRDAERIRRAEEALVAGEPRRASLLASSVAANSPLFAQSERLARSAHDQLEHTAEQARAPTTNTAQPAQAPRSLDVTVALSEALALYESGNFAGAAERASSLAEQAQPDVRAELLRWAQDARRFAQRYQTLPTDEANLVHHVQEASEAVSLDERLSDGHYARDLRSRMVTALSDLARVLFDRNELIDACWKVRDALSFALRNDQVEVLSRRCDNEAFRRIAQARELERSKPDQALKLYKQALSIATQGSASYRAAQSALGDLEWSSQH
jgi:hypothetical protein